MNVLHMVSGVGAALDTLVRILNDQGELYHRIDVEVNQPVMPMIPMYDLIVLECAEITGVYELLITRVLYQSKPLSPVIVITDHFDFWMASNLLDKGVMSVMTKLDFDEARFVSYLEMLKKDFVTLAVLRQMRIAAFDESQFSLDLMKRYFTQYDIQNVTFYKAVLALEVMDYDLFIISLANEAERLIAAIRAQKKDAIIIVVTAHGSVLSHCLSIGADDFLFKPFDFKVFVLRLQRVLQSSKAVLEHQLQADQLYEQSIKDRLTGLYNRGYFIDSLKVLSSKSMRTHEPIAIMLLDLDHFKRVNDTYGHKQGDLVLKQIAEVLQANSRNSDIVCRWGGEEFCIVCPDTTLEKANVIAEKIRCGVQRTDFNLRREITTSIGVTVWEIEDTEDTCFRRLDNSLYLAKLTGRNKVVSNEELLISECDFPVSVSWGPFFKSGNAQIDMEHRALINISNEIIANCFIPDNHRYTLELFLKLASDTQTHFENEEAILERYNYPKLEEHRRTHTHLLSQTQLMYSLLKDGDLNSVEVAKYVVQEVVIGHIIKSDFEFYDLFRKRTYGD